MRLKTQEEFKQEVFDLIGDEYYVIGNYISNKNPITMRHKKCGYEFDVTPNNFLSKNSRCPYCTNHKVMRGFNDIYTTNRELAMMLLNENDRYSYTKRSNIKLDWVCPQCNNIVRNKTPDKVGTYGLMCPFCSDGISYPNKFVHSMFSQIMNQIDNYIAEYSPNWAQKKRYDNYFRKDNAQYIFEVDGGLGHGKTAYYGNEAEILHSLEVDKYKEKLASEHGIRVIRIDADESNMDYMINSILKSELACILDLSMVDWNQCNIDAMKSKKMEVINCFNQGIKNINDICDKISNVKYDAAYHYLLDGAKHGLCDYNPNDYIKYRRKPKDVGVKVICLNTGKVYASIIEASNDYHIKSSSNILACCVGKYKSAGKNDKGEKLRWMYYDEYLGLTDDEKEQYMMLDKFKYKKPTNTYTGISVINLETKQVFLNANEAAKYYSKKDGSSIRKCTKNTELTAYGYHWMNYKEYINLTLSKSA